MISDFALFEFEKILYLDDLCLLTLLGLILFFPITMGDWCSHAKLVKFLVINWRLLTFHCFLYPKTPKTNTKSTIKETKTQNKPCVDIIYKNLLSNNYDNFSFRLPIL